MESKKIIAIDIDDVLATNAAGFIDWSNKAFGTQLTVDDYHEHWAELWKVDLEEAKRRSTAFHESDHVSTYAVIEDAREALEQLKKNYSLVLLTSRRTVLEKLTKEWIDKYYPGIFDECVFCGFYDLPGIAGLHLTKGARAKEINANYLIDDQLKHVEAAAEAGVTGLLFGDYSWNKKEQLPAGVTRVRNWKDVLEYFENQNKSNA